MFTWLKTKKHHIFKHLNDVSDVLLEVGDELAKVPVSFPDAIAERAQRMRELEAKADAITHVIMDEINRSFVTPIDREDLYVLAHRIDDVIDLAEDAVSHFVVYGVTEGRPPLDKFCETIFQVTRELAAAIRGLEQYHQPAHISHHNIQIRLLESRGDELLKEALADLFAHEQDAKTVLKWKDIFWSFERSLDRAQDVADVIEGILLKHT